MSIDMENDKKAKALFEKLSPSGEIRTDFQKTSYEFNNGSVSDQYGTH
ncbi:hypothetical protein [Psychroflexus torquis]|nr:hypothetical protein [Psychroflexus torquis]